MGIAELRNQTQLQMPLKKLALPGEGDEAPSPPPAPQPPPLGGEAFKLIFFPFEELDLPGMNLLKHGIVQSKLWDADLARCGAARHTAQVSQRC